MPKNVRPDAARRRGLAVFFALLLALIAAAVLCDRTVRSRLFPPSADAELTVCFLDVGEGDAALLLSGGEAMLIDGGPKAAEETLLAELERRGVGSLRYLVATHPHEDHIGGLPAVLETLSVETCWMPEDAADTVTFENLLTELEERDVAVTVPAPGDSVSFGSCTVTVLAPLSAAEEHNNNSLVLRVTCGETAFLFTGDMEAAEEGELLASGAELSADVLKVAHHGSQYATGEAFLQAVGPDTAVISCGADNDYFHPHDRLLRRLGEQGIAVFRTDRMGTVTVRSDGTGITVRTEEDTP